MQKSHPNRLIAKHDVNKDQRALQNKIRNVKSSIDKTNRMYQNKLEERKKREGKFQQTKTSIHDLGNIDQQERDEIKVGDVNRSTKEMQSKSIVDPDEYMQNLVSQYLQRSNTSQTDRPKTEYGKFIPPSLGSSKASMDPTHQYRKLMSQYMSPKFTPLPGVKRGRPNTTTPGGTLGSNKDTNTQNIDLPEELKKCHIQMERMRRIIEQKDHQIHVLKLHIGSLKGIINKTGSEIPENKIAPKISKETNINPKRITRPASSKPGLITWSTGGLNKPGGIISKGEYNNRRSASTMENIPEDNSKGNSPQKEESRITEQSNEESGINDDSSSKSPDLCAKDLSAMRNVIKDFEFEQFQKIQNMIDMGLIADWGYNNPNIQNDEISEYVGDFENESDLHMKGEDAYTESQLDNIYQNIQLLDSDAQVEDFQLDLEGIGKDIIQDYQVKGLNQDLEWEVAQTNSEEDDANLDDVSNINAVDQSELQRVFCHKYQQTKNKY